MLIAIIIIYYYVFGKDLPPQARDYSQFAGTIKPNWSEAMIQHVIVNCGAIKMEVIRWLLCVYIQITMLHNESTARHCLLFTFVDLCVYFTYYLRPVARDQCK